MEETPEHEPMLIEPEEPPPQVIEIPESEQMDDTPLVTPSETPASTSMEEDGTLGTHTWVIRNWSKESKNQEKIYSEKFEIATYFWRLLIFPRKNGAAHLAVYLDAPEASYTPLSMSPKASFKLYCVNTDPSKNYMKETSHTFTPSETDWGFTQFISLDELHAKNSGYIVDDTITLRVDITIQKDERWSHDSRKETGSVGLKNQGATCYMNSLLQYLFHVPYFRQAVYHMPSPENEEPSKSLPLALQSLFYKLQYSNTAVSTKDLTKSFGWGTYDAFMQHDVQELNRVLCEKLEDKMKGTRVEKAINLLFEGHTTNYLQCINVNYKSERKESYMDLQLDVKGCKHMYDSFNRYTEEETMDGQNQYNAEGFGLQDAKKGVLFESFPPVLQLQLKRFEYDFQRDTMVKINDRYEFFEELDLDREDYRYLSPNADRSVRNLYKLHSVLVHSGGVHGGHYYAFIRPDGQQWLKFDDDRVTKEDSRKAMDEQFGGEDETPPITSGGYAPAPPTFKFAKYSNAYMLVYVRVSDWPRIMCETGKDDIAEHLRKQLEHDQLVKEGRHKEKAEAHLYCTLKIVQEEDFKAQIGSTQFFDLVNHDKVPPEKGHYRIRKQTKFSEFKQEVALRTGVPVERQRYWSWSRRQNHTFRPNRILTPLEEEQPLMELREHRETTQPVNKHALMDLKLYLEVAPEGGPPLAKMSKFDLLLFFKYYDPVAETLTYVQKGIMPKSTKVSEIMPHLKAAVGLPPEAETDLYEEIKFDPTVMVNVLERSKTLGLQEMENGDIMVLQRRLSEDEARTVRHPTVSSYLQYIYNRRVVTWRKLDDPKGEGLKLEMLRDMNYDEVAAQLAQAIGLQDPACLRFTQLNAYSQAPQRNPLKWRGMVRLEQMLTHGVHINEIMYYEVLDLPLQELETLKTLRVSFHNEKSEFVAEHSLRLPREGTVRDALALLKTLLGPAHMDDTLRMLELLHCRIFKEVPLEDTVESINDTYWTLRAEAIPPDQIDVPPNSRIIQVCHYHADPNDTSGHVTNFGEPFLFTVDEEETVGSVKQRIQAKLGVADDEFAKWIFAFVSPRFPPEILTDDIILASCWSKLPGGLSASETHYLGMSHEDRMPKRPATNTRYNFEKPVKIYS